jgi:hypothetical protein
MSKRGAALSCGLAAVALVVGWAAASAQPMPTNPVAMANVRQSERYSNLVRTDPSFRAKRIQEECGPITDPHLHEQCVASFPGAPAPRR